MIECRICGGKYKQITTSGHLKKHGIDRQEYSSQFPSAPLISDETKKLHSLAIKKQVSNGTHFVPFRDIDGLAQRVHDSHKEGPIEYSCIRCGKKKQANRFIAERRMFCSNKCHSLHISENPTLYLERNEKIRRSNKGRAKKGGYSRCNGGFRNDIGHYVRSGWEADICRIFKYCGRPYDYESYTVSLDSNGKIITWVVDFVDSTHLLSDGLLEVKGWWDAKSKMKLALLKLQRPELYNRLTIIDSNGMRRLTLLYRDVIANWETRKRRTK